LPERKPLIAVLRSGLLLYSFNNSDQAVITHEAVWQEDTMSDQPYITTGTTEPIYIASDAAQRAIKQGRSYFVIRLRNAQVAFQGSFWERAKQLIVTSQVDLHLKSTPSLSEPFMAIQHSRKVTRGRAEKLGLCPNLVNLVPATMGHITISLEFILDIKNKLAALGGLINNEAFLSAISLAPGVAVAAHTISNLSEKILQTFLEPEERKPILQFRGDFNIATDELKDGYYVILGTRDRQHPIPRPLPALQLRDGDLLADGGAVTQWSYVILEVRSLKARTRDLSDNAEWTVRLSEAEAEAQAIAGNPLADEEEKERTWNRCLEILKESQVLLRADSNYLRCETEDIIREVYSACYRDIFGREIWDTTTPSMRGKLERTDYLPGRPSGLALLDIPQSEDLQTTLSRYSMEVVEARAIIAREDIH
jgi:hypothetical protein